MFGCPFVVALPCHEVCALALVGGRLQRNKKKIFSPGWLEVGALELGLEPPLVPVDIRNRD